MYSVETRLIRKMMKMKKKTVSPEVEKTVNRIIDGRKEMRRKKKEAIQGGDWADIIPLIAEEPCPDISEYKEQMEKAGITLEVLRKIALYSGARIVRMVDTGSLEISLRKSDHSAVVVISKEGKMNTLMKDYLTY